MKREKDISFSIIIFLLQVLRRYVRIKQMKNTYAEFTCPFKMIKSTITDLAVLTTFIANLEQSEKLPVLQ